MGITNTMSRLWQRWQEQHSFVKWFQYHSDEIRDAPNKEVVLDLVRTQLETRGFRIASTDANRQWGGFHVIDETQAVKFAREFFPQSEVLAQARRKSLRLTPKIIVVAPGEELSWQWHRFRSECHLVVVGPVLYFLNTTDELPPYGHRHFMRTGEFVRIHCQERHRLASNGEFGVVAEMWLHEDPSNPSFEDDVVRILDKYGRGTPNT